MIYPGFDTFSYPGDTTMQSIYDNTDLWWCGFYLGPGFNWHAHFRTIQQMGWGVAPIYTGKQPGSSPKLKAIHAKYAGDSDALLSALWDNGAADGKEAADQASASGIPTATILYFDVENTVHDSDWLQYYRGWSRAVVDRYYCVGLYTRTEHAGWVTGRLMGGDLPNPFDICMPAIWIAKYNRAIANGAPVPPEAYLEDPHPTPDPKTVYSGASVWQHIGNYGLKWTDSGKTRKFAPVDYDSSTYPDPGRGFLSLVTS